MKTQRTAMKQTCHGCHTPDVIERPGVLVYWRAKSRDPGPVTRGRQEAGMAVDNVQQIGKSTRVRETRPKGFARSGEGTCCKAKSGAADLHCKPPASQSNAL